MQGSTQDISLFASSNAGTARLVGYLIFAVFLMVMDYRHHYLVSLRDKLQLLSDPVYWVAALPARTIRSARGALSDRETLLKDNAALREQLLFAHARLARLAAVQGQNNRLRNLLDVKTKLNLKAQLAELVEVDLDPFRHLIMLDSGRKQNIRKGQAVIDAYGVLGQVLDVFPDKSSVILITDPSHAVPVRIARTGLRTIAYGTGDPNSLRLPHVPFSADIRVDDELVTSGLGGRFPAGLPVGIVKTVTQDDSATFAVAIAAPIAGISRSSEVLVLHDFSETLRPDAAAERDFIGPPEALPIVHPPEFPVADQP